MAFERQDEDGLRWYAPGPESRHENRPGRREVECVVTAGPGIVEVSRRLKNPAPRNRGPVDPDDYEAVVRERERMRNRGAVTMARTIKVFSDKSRNNLRKKIAKIDWNAVPGELVLLTLTYPKVFPVGSVICKRHVRLFRQRWNERFPDHPITGFWVQEWQDRGALHFHLWVGLPDGEVLVRDERAGYGHGDDGRLVWDWALEAWYEIVGSGDPKHRSRGVDVTRAFEGQGVGTNANLVADYFWRESGKDNYQKAVPDGWGNPGKFWQMMGNVPWKVFKTVVPEDEYYPVRRAVFRVRDEKAGRKIPLRPGSLQGGWALATDGIALAVALVRCVENARRDPDGLTA